MKSIYIDLISYNLLRETVNESERNIFYKDRKRIPANDNIVVTKGEFVGNDKYYKINHKTYSIYVDEGARFPYISINNEYDICLYLPNNNARIIENLLEDINKKNVLEMYGEKMQLNASERINECEENIKELRKRLEWEEKQLISAKADLRKWSSNFKKRIAKEIKEIEANNWIKSVKYGTGIIAIETEEIVCHEPYTDRYYYIAPSVLIELDIVNARITYDCDDEYKRIGYWEYPMVHPHVDYSGHPCLGNTEYMVVEALEDGEINLAANICYNYLKITNIDDCAGYGISLWDEIEGDAWLTERKIVIKKAGHAPSYDEYDSMGDCDAYDNYNDSVVGTCDVCGEDIYGDEGETCSRCNGTVHTNCGKYLYINDDCSNKFICDSCFYNYLDCGAIYDANENRLYTIDFIDEYFTKEDFERFGLDYDE